MCVQVVLKGRNWEIPAGSVVKSLICLGTGSYGSVYLATYLGSKVRNCCLCVFKCCLRRVLMQPTGRPELEVYR